MPKDRNITKVYERVAYSLFMARDDISFCFVLEQIALRIEALSK